VKTINAAYLEQLFALMKKQKNKKEFRKEKKDNIIGPMCHHSNVQTVSYFCVKRCY